MKMKKKEHCVTLKVTQCSVQLILIIFPGKHLFQKNNFFAKRDNDLLDLSAFLLSLLRKYPKYEVRIREDK